MREPTPGDSAGNAAPTPRASARNIGIVVIGRNEGERLVRCLTSIRELASTVVYVDSSSSDGSQARAAAMGVHVMELPLDKPFTAGRARNAGFARLLELNPQLEYVQFVDGDCELADGWLAASVALLDRTPQVAIACGRRKERFPERSIYNRLCDIEWDTPIGIAEACGGDFMVRAQVFSEVGGFNESLIAGEEPEMCYRIRKLGRQIWRLDAAMTLHDAAITRFSQWARRTSRAGYAYAARAALHLRDGTRYCLRENSRIAVWALSLPLIVAMAFVSRWFLLLALLYPLSYARTARRIRSERPQDPAFAYSFFLLVGKWPEFYGQMLFLVRWLRGQEQQIIEYK